ncbi:MAG: hypothetical protein IJZ75_06250, partial [Clostridia bacterium]|nr:hypothetical protein [Clostridia bacterium]
MLNKKTKAPTVKVSAFIIGAGDGNFPIQRIYRLAYARCHVGENSPQDYFLPQTSLLPPCSIP